MSFYWLSLILTAVFFISSISADALEKKRGNHNFYYYLFKLTFFRDFLHDTKCRCFYYWPVQLVLNQLDY